MTFFEKSITENNMRKLLIALSILSVAAYGSDAKVKGKVLDGNTIEITADTPGTYTLVYEGAGCKPLADYAPICTLEVEQLAKYEDFIDANAAPVQAKSIGIYDAADKRVGSVMPLQCVFNALSDFSNPSGVCAKSTNTLPPFHSPTCCKRPRTPLSTRNPPDTAESSIPSSTAQVADASAL